MKVIMDPKPAYRHPPGGAIDPNNPPGRPRSCSAPTIKLLTVQRRYLTAQNFKTSWDLLPRSPVFRGHEGNARRSSFAMQREHFESHLCRINVLLVSMQLGLGASMLGLAFFLRQFTDSLTWREIAFWASGPLMACGVFGLYFCLPDRRLITPSRLGMLARVWVGILSFFTTIITMVASVFSGIHGNWISSNGGSCPAEEKNSRKFTECCADGFKMSPVTNLTQIVCGCYLNGVQVREYVNIECRNVISGLKDYLILQCALMAVASGVCFWLVVILWQTRPRRHRQHQHLTTVAQRNLNGPNSRAWDAGSVQTRKHSQKRLISTTTTSEITTDSGDTDVP